jgi:adenylate cyclase class IV
MPRNVEIKARVVDRDALVRRAEALATEGPIEIAQDDTFFPCEHGRLKLRAFSEERGELIFYRRPDVGGPRESFYLRSPTSSPATLRESLALAYGIAGSVRKQRTLFLCGRSRIHVDRVSFHAFQYKWNCSSVAVVCVMLRQTIVSVPVIVRVAAFSVAAIV